MVINNVYAAGDSYNGLIWLNGVHVFATINASNQTGTSIQFNLTTDENQSIETLLVPTLEVCNSTYPACMNLSATQFIDTGGTGNYTNATVNLNTSSEGRSNVTFWWRNGTVEDTANKTQRVTFYVDRSVPRWTEISIVANNTNRSVTDFMINISVDFTYTIAGSVFLEFSNETTKTNYSLPCTATSTLSADGYTPLYNCGKQYKSFTTNQTVYWNYTIYVTDGAGYVNKSGMYFFKVDNSTPSIGSGVLMQVFGNSTQALGDNLAGPWENNMTIRFNVTHNSTDTQPCYVRAWVESADSAGLKTWTLNTTKNLSGYYGVAGSLRNCTVNINGTDIKNIMGIADAGVVKLESVATDNMGHIGYGQNFTVVYNNLKTGWNPIGWTSATYTLRAIASYVRYNASYVSVWNNDFQNASWVTWQNPVNAANATTVSNSNYSAVYLYMDNPWIMLRSLTKTAVDTVWIPVNSMGINQTWSLYSTGFSMEDGNATLFCLGGNLSFKINTSAPFTPYANYSDALVNAYSDANSSWGDPFGINGLTGGSNFTYNATCFNITNMTYSVTNIMYNTTPAKTSWQAIATFTANTTNQTLTQVNATDLAWQNISDTRCSGGCFIYYSLAQPHTNNETVIPAGNMVWVLPDTTGWDRYSTVKIWNNNTAVTGTFVRNVTDQISQKNGIVKIWKRPA